MLGEDFKKVLIFGNSGSGKLTLAAHPPKRALLEHSKEKISGFLNAHSIWVIEGGYSDLYVYQ